MNGKLVPSWPMWYIGTFTASGGCPAWYSSRVLQSAVSLSYQAADQLLSLWPLGRQTVLA